MDDDERVERLLRAAFRHEAAGLAIAFDPERLERVRKARTSRASAWEMPLAAAFGAAILVGVVVALLATGRVPGNDSVAGASGGVIDGASPTMASPRAVTCAYEPPEAGPSTTQQLVAGPIELIVSDSTGLVLECVVYDRVSGAPLGEGLSIGVRNTSADRSMLQVDWWDTLCARSAGLHFAETTSGFDLVLEPATPPTECPAQGFPYGARLSLSAPIPAALVTASEVVRAGD